MEEAREVFLAHETDARALCFATIFAWHSDDIGLKQAAETGFAFALAELAACLHQQQDKEAFSFAFRASLQGERDGFYWVGQCYERGLGCEQNLGKAKENYRIAGSILLYAPALSNLGSLFDKSDPQRWHWLGKAAARGSPRIFLREFVAVVYRFYSTPSLAPVVFMIGRALAGHMGDRKIFGVECTDTRFETSAANRAFRFFTLQCEAARAAVDVWCLIARRRNNLLNRDVRKKIAMLIWEARELAQYRVELDSED